MGILQLVKHAAETKHKYVDVIVKFLCSEDWELLIAVLRGDRYDWQMVFVWKRDFQPSLRWPLCMSLWSVS